MKLTAAVLILAGLLVALANLGITLGRWWAPIILVGAGLIYLLFPEEMKRWRAERQAERRHRREGQ